MSSVPVDSEDLDLMLKSLEAYLTYWLRAAKSAKADIVRDAYLSEATKVRALLNTYRSLS